MESSRIAEILARCRLFEGLSETQRWQIAGLGHIEELAAGELLYEQGAQSSALYVVDEGRVSLERHLSLSDTRTASVTVYVARGGARHDVLGCWCTLVGKQRVQMCSAFCDRPTRVVAIPCAELRQLLVEDPPLGMKVLEQLVLALRDRIEFSLGVMENL